MSASSLPRVLEGCAVLPPLLSPEEATGHRGNRPSKAKGKAGERFAVLNAFTDLSLAGLTRAEIAVWLVLFRDTRDGSARTGLTDIARRAGCHRSTAFRALRRLERRGLLTVIHRGGLGRGPSRYQVSPVPRQQ
jgi:hypothetical protein